MRLVYLRIESIAAVISNVNAELMDTIHAASGIVVYCVIYKVTISTKYSFANDFLILELLNDTEHVTEQPCQCLGRKRNWL